MCQGGVVRSVALKHLLVYGDAHGQGTTGYGCRDVIACGWATTSGETREMLFAWADTIIIMQDAFRVFIPAPFHRNPDGSKRLFVIDVGPDVWRTPFHPELEPKLRQLVEESDLFKP